MNEDIAGAHGIPQLTLFYLAHAIFISYGLSNDFLSFVLRNDLSVQGLNKLRRGPHTTVFKVVFHFFNYSILILLSESGKLEKSYNRKY
jgi:hypothetical protein